MNTLGERLRKARERKGLSQVKVKERTGINNKTLSGYEHGVSEPDYETLKILANLYEVSVDWLVGNTNDPAPKKENINFEEHEFIKEIRKIAEEKGFELTDPRFLNILKAAFDFAKRISEDQRNQQ